MPGPLREAAGFSYQEFSNLREPLALKGDPFHTGGANKVSVWAEFLMPDTAKPLAYYDHPFFGKYPAITRNAFGKGTLTYEGTSCRTSCRRACSLTFSRLQVSPGPTSSYPGPCTSSTGPTMRGAACITT